MMVDYAGSLKDSLCVNCAFFVSRIIVPLDPESFDFSLIDPSDLVDMDDNELVAFRHCFCKEGGIELDHDVLECNMFKRKTMSSLMKELPK